MKHEFHAQFALALQDSMTQAFAIDWLAGKSKKLPHQWPEIQAIQDEYQRILLLSETLMTRYKEQAKMGTRREPGGLRYWTEQRAPVFLAQRLQNLRQMGLVPGLPNLSLFPSGAWALHFAFTLRKPYISRDDTELHILENPVKKEWVFKVPYVAPGQWKGALRAAMVRELVAWRQKFPGEEREAEEFAKRRFWQTLLFGSEKGEETGNIKSLAKYLDDIGGKKATGLYRQHIREYFKIKEKEDLPNYPGRLHFFPTFFDKIGLEVINPHDRETGSGSRRGPILMECVPKGAQGGFTLLYAPVGLLAAENGAAADMGAIAKGIHAMLTQYGFGAKTSSGYGLAEIDHQTIQVKPDNLETIWKKAFSEENKQPCE